MADTSGMADIRGLNIDKLVKGFAEEELVLKKYVENAKTSAREIRWYKKTAGFLTGVATTGMTASNIANQSSKSMFTVAEPEWTRVTSYVRRFSLESPWISDADLADADVPLFTTCIRDLTKGVQNQEEIRIYNVLTESMTPVNIQTAVCYGTGWADGTSGNPIGDILSAKAAIKNYNYNPEGAVMYMHTTEEKNLLTWLISTKGSSIPQYASSKVQDGVIMSLLGLDVVSSNNATVTKVAIFVPKKAATWKEFTPMSSAILTDPGIGKKIRIWSEGEALLTDPKAVVLLTSA